MWLCFLPSSLFLWFSLSLSLQYPLDLSSLPSNQLRPDFQSDTHGPFFHDCGQCPHWSHLTLTVLPFGVTAAAQRLPVVLFFSPFFLPPNRNGKKKSVPVSVAKLWQWMKRERESRKRVGRNGDMEIKAKILFLGHFSVAWFRDAPDLVGLSEVRSSSETRGGDSPRKKNLCRVRSPISLRLGSNRPCKGPV